MYNLTNAPDSAGVWIKSIFTNKAYVKRRIEVANIVSISLSEKSNEFVLHVPTEYDYRFESKDRDGIIHMIVYQILKTKDKKATFKFIFHDREKLDYIVKKRTDTKSKEIKVGIMEMNLKQF